MAEIGLIGLLRGIFWGIIYWFESMFRFFVPQERKDVSGKVVLVTGAGSGIGQKLSVEFARLGCTVVGWDISSQGLEQTGEILAAKKMKSQWHAYRCDLSDRSAIYEAAEKVNEDVGSVDILINNAGIVTGKRLLECRDELILKTMEVNAIAHFWTLKAFLPHMIDHNSGHVVSIASGAGLFGVPGQCDYAASKFAAVGLMEALYLELQHNKVTGVKTTLVCPYYINTGMFDGVSTSFLPIIQADDAVNQIVDAVLRDKPLLLMPRLLNFLLFLKGLMPVKTALSVGNATGVLSSMDSFTGRK